MITHSGQAIFPKGSEHYDPASVPTIADIARGLGRMVRFAGQVIIGATVSITVML